ncbi:MAG: hypothetical protein HYV09_35620 [Deltaproteobacteria bacterium]|nr:hypothetical protein [Deltaproteobacteria bacterium]
MDRRSFLLASAALTTSALPGCKSKAQKQAEAAVADIARIERLVADRHVDSLARALPIAATALGAKIDKPIGPEEAKTIGPAFDELRNKSDDLRSAKRSYFAITDPAGEIVWVDDTTWVVVGRKLAVAFPASAEVAAGKKPYAAGSGRYGGASPEALTFFEVAPIVHRLEGGDTRVGLLVAAWEVHEVAEDLQRQLQTDLAMKTVKPKVRAKQKDKYQLALDTPDLWVAVFGKDFIWLQEGAPQQLEDGAKAIGLHAKTAAGPWSGTFDVMNKSWGGAAKRLPALGPDIGLAVLRHDP